MAKELQRYFFTLEQTVLNSDMNVKVRLPPGKKLLLKGVQCVIRDMDAQTGANSFYVRVGLHNTKEMGTGTYNSEAKNSVVQFMLQQSTDTAVGTNMSPPMPLVWLPPPGYFLYGPVLLALLESGGAANIFSGFLVVYGTLSDMTDLEAVQQTVNL